MNPQHEVAPMTCPAHATRLAVTTTPRSETNPAQVQESCRYCPFLRDCDDCEWRSEWVCQVCHGISQPGESVCDECAGEPT